MLQTNAAHIQPKHTAHDIGSAPKDIVKRLEELNQWQDKQQKLLQKKQSVQRQRLGMEQMTMYEMLGLRHCDELPIRAHFNAQSSQKDTSPRRASREQPINTAIQGVTISSDEEEDLADSNDESNLCSPLALMAKGAALPTAQRLNEGNNNQPKRAFLKRGEGLKKRFKIDPDALRLVNLPSYKFAKTHANLNPRGSCPRPPIRKQKETAPPDTDASLDVNEQRFQRMLLAAQNGCNSTPDTKAASSGTQLNAMKPLSAVVGAPMRVRFADGNSGLPQQPNGTDEAVERIFSHQSSLNSSDSCMSLPIAWAKVLDSQQIRPLPMHQLRATTEQCKSEENERENLSIFELLEQKASEGTIDMNSSCIQRLMQQRAKTDESVDVDEIHVDQRFRGAGLRPAVSEVLNESNCSSTSSSTDGASEEANESDALTIESTNGDALNTNGTGVENSNVGADANAIIDDAQEQPIGQKQIHVRFLDIAEKYEDVYSTSSESTLAGDETSLNQSNELFEQFKEALFAALQSNVEKDLNNDNNKITKNPSDKTNAVAVLPVASLRPSELQEKTELIKQRLVELESEIATFKMNNQTLLKARQEHELDVAHFECERSEEMARMKDERIQMEMYLHDERMKMEEDRRRFEQQLRKDGTQNKDRKEVVRLKQELEAAQIQLRTKEQAHAAAQARLRVQIRNLERDQKQHYEDIERLSKENKRLQTEMTQRERESNKKMLQEINRNIAKLAPKLSMGSTPSTLEGDQRGMCASRRPLNIAGPMSTSRVRSQRSLRTPPPTHKPLPPQKTPLREIRCMPRSHAKEISTRGSISASQPTFSGRSYRGQENCPTVPSNTDNEDNDAYKDVCDDDDDDEDEDEENAEIVNALRNIEVITAVVPKVDVCPVHAPNVVNHSPVALDTSKTLLRSSPCLNDARKSKTSADLTLCAGDSNHNINDSHKSISCTSQNSLGIEFKREIINDDGSRDIWYPNGNLKKFSADGMVIRMLYFNKDIKETNINEGTVRYYYAESNTWQTTYLDGLEILEFPNGQTEQRHKNGIVETHFPNNSIKIVNPADEFKEEEWKFEDGSTMLQMRNGDKILMLPNGQKEIHTKLHKRREYPDGTVKTVYPDGSHETRYSNGRVRLRDKDGQLLMDTMDIK